MPLKRIAAALGVSPSSVLAWTADIQLTEEQHRHNLRGPTGPLHEERIRTRAKAWSERCRARRAEFQAEGRLRAREGDPLHYAGCMLYWAEGSKSRNTLTFANSDPYMLRLFLRFLRETFGVEAERIRIRLNVYTGNGLSVWDIERYWLDLLQLPRSSLRKHTLDHTPTSSSGRALNKLPYGVCNLRVTRSTQLVQHIFGAIQEYGDFDEPAWLD